jgi:hypothetical protein
MAKTKEVKIKLTERESTQLNDLLDAMGYTYAIKKTGKTYDKARFIRDLLSGRKAITSLRSHDRKYISFRVELGDRANIDQIKNL